MNVTVVGQSRQGFSTNICSVMALPYNETDRSVSHSAVSGQVSHFGGTAGATPARTISS